MISALWIKCELNTFNEWKTCPPLIVPSNTYIHIIDTDKRGIKMSKCLKLSRYLKVKVQVLILWLLTKPLHCAAAFINLKREIITGKILQYNPILATFRISYLPPPANQSPLLHRWPHTCFCITQISCSYTDCRGHS